MIHPANDCELSSVCIVLQILAVRPFRMVFTQKCAHLVGRSDVDVSRGPNVAEIDTSRLRICARIDELGSPTMFRYRSFLFFSSLRSIIIRIALSITIPHFVRRTQCDCMSRVRDYCARAEKMLFERAAHRGIMRKGERAAHSSPSGSRSFCPPFRIPSQLAFCQTPNFAPFGSDDKGEEWRPPYERARDCYTSRPKTTGAHGRLMRSPRFMGRLKMCTHYRTHLSESIGGEKAKQKERRRARIEQRITITAKINRERCSSRCARCAAAASRA